MLPGRPLDNTAIYLLDENHHPVVSGEKGELYVSGLNLAQGYVRGRDPNHFLPNSLTVDPGKSVMRKCIGTDNISVTAHTWMKNSNKISCFEILQNFFKGL
jgi:hypothetical protein